MTRFIDTPYNDIRHNGSAATCEVVALLGGGTSGSTFALIAPGSINGARGYDPHTGVHTLRVSLWKQTCTWPGGAFGLPTRIEYVDVARTGIGAYEVTFTPYAVTEDRLCVDEFAVSVHILGEDFFIRSNNSGFNPFGVYDQAKRFWCITGQNEYRISGGDTEPFGGSTSAGAAPISPLVVIENSLYLPTPWCTQFGLPRADVTTIGTPPYDNMTVGRCLFPWQENSFYGWRFYTAGAGAHNVKLRFGIAQNSNTAYAGNVLATQTQACVGPGEHSVMLGTPVAITQALMEEAYSKQSVFFVSMYTNGWITGVSPDNWLRNQSTSTGLRTPELGDYYGTVWIAGDASIDVFGFPSVGYAVPLDPWIGRINP